VHSAITVRLPARLMYIEMPHSHSMLYGIREYVHFGANERHLTGVEIRFDMIPGSV
jgi:hypothetical protein